MAITDLRVNRVINPLCVRLEDIVFSFIYEGTDESFTFHLYDESGKELHKETVSGEKSILFRVKYAFQKGKAYSWVIQGLKDKSQPAFFQTEIDFQPALITCPNQVSHPVFKKDFSLKGKLAQAKLYITGLGLYKAFINGKKAGDLFLTPGFNDYSDKVRYQVYDVLSLLKEGKNQIKAVIGDGWYKGRIGFDRVPKGIWGEDSLLAATLFLKFADGHEEKIETDKSWEYSPSVYLSTGIYDGEELDETIKEEFKPCSISDKKLNYVGQDEAFIKEICQLKGKLIVTPKGENVIDFGQNAAGYVRVHLHCPKGTNVTLRYGEVLQGGCFYTENLRTAKSMLSIVSDGTDHCYDEAFTYHGGRYVKVEGLDKVNPDDFVFIVFSSDTEDTSSFTCSDKEIEKLTENVVWGQRGNFIDIPTDCPQRDERMGWTADTQVFSRTAMLQGECFGFYKKFIDDMICEQNMYYDGDIPDYVPSLRKHANPAGAVWADAMTIIPMNLYKCYGDKELLKKHAWAMGKYADYWIRHDKANGSHHLIREGFTYGDWLALDGPTQQSTKGGTEDAYIQSMYYYLSLSLTSEAFKIIGEKKKSNYYAEWAKKAKSAILAEYFTLTGRLAIDTQTGYILSLYTGIYYDKARIIEGLKSRFMKDKNTLKTGFTGTPLLLPVMFDAGLDEQAYKVLFNPGFPGWIYQVRLGATTVWERWNSLLEDGTISGTGMNSLNHYANGTVAEGIYTRIMGLRILKPGFKKVLIKPHLNWRMRKADFCFNSPAGKYQIAFDIRSDQTVAFDITVPYGATAALELPDREKEIAEGGTHHIEYKLKKDIIHPFGINTPIIELFKNPKTADIIKSSQLLSWVAGNDEYNGASIYQVTQIKAFPITSQEVDDIVGRLNKIEG